MKITFLRHAHAHHAGDDKNRVLSPKGIEQAFYYKQLINHQHITYDMVICSSAVRTKETADIILYNSPKQAPCIELSGLYLPKNDSDITEISKSLMLFPRSTLNEALKRDKTGAWNRYAEQAYGEISSALEDNKGKINSSSHILIIGHGVILNFIALKFMPTMEAIKQRYVGYLEGFSIPYIS